MSGKSIIKKKNNKQTERNEENILMSISTEARLFVHVGNVTLLRLQ